MLDNLKNFLKTNYEISIELELFIILGLSSLALLTGRALLQRLPFIEKNENIKNVFRFSYPLLYPIIIALFFTLGRVTLHKQYDSLLLFPFAVKLSTAWLLIRSTILITNRKIAGWLIVAIILPMTVLDLFGLWTPLVTFLDNISLKIGTIELSAYHLLKSIFLILILLWAARGIVSFTENKLQTLHFVKERDQPLVSKIFQITLYIIVFFMSLEIIGIDLTTFAVFGGAFFVGVGLGLQKIASNFISGIILSLERSIEVSNLVQLQDGTWGTVKKTAARYTLLEGFDGKEILIPNEEFITQRVTNWTFSNTRARIDIQVGVAYNSDLTLAKNLMIQAAEEHPRCAKNPPPQVYLTQFQESSINLLLHFWINDVQQGRFGVTSDVLMGIWNKFKEHGIQLPYPQRHIHIINDNK